MVIRELIVSPQKTLHSNALPSVSRLCVIYSVCTGFVKHRPWLQTHLIDSLTSTHAHTHFVPTATGAGVAVDTVYPSAPCSPQSSRGINQYPRRTESTPLMCARRAQWVFVEPPGEAPKGLTLLTVVLGHRSNTHTHTLPGF